MIVQHKPQLHLTYCLNIHPGESWAENLAAITNEAAAVRAAVLPEGWFGLGMRISAQAAQELLISEQRNHLLDVLAAQEMYPFSVNAFPYGRFHNEEVKETVYAPDWRTPERRDYTIKVADTLATLLPASIEGSISTVPGSFRPWITNDDDQVQMARHLAACVAYLVALEEDTGRLIHLGLEPEPDCFLETTAETIAFFENVIFVHGVQEVERLLKCDRAKAEGLVRRHLGVCFDTCHVALQFEDPLESLKAYEAAGIRISKVQLSAALQCASRPEVWEALQAFEEPVYLHQVKGRTTGGGRVAWYDLPDALHELPDFEDIEELRVHFHVPLFFKGNDLLQSTADTLTPDFMRYLRSGVTSHLEIETYTFNVLPAEHRPKTVVQSVAREYQWVQERL